MKTLLTDSLDYAAALIKNGDLVAIPTETVYGLAADALNETAVKKIFTAKGRPSDNPLIVHISTFEEIFPLVSEIPSFTKILADSFWPGPLTMILKKSDAIPEVTSGGLDTVAIRLPNSDIARDLIRKSQTPLAAPSANTSGKPSPTTYNHVLNDLDGKISAILKGPSCSIGVESTVIDLTSDPIRLLRPGKITADQISEVINKNVIIDESVNHSVSDLKNVRSPGVKYKHYSPKTKVILVKGSIEKFANIVNSCKNCVAMGFNEDSESIKTNFLSYGSESSQETQLHLLFDCLRKIDDYNAEIAYVHIASNNHLNLAVFNRLLRAAAFDVI